MSRFLSFAFHISSATQASERLKYFQNKFHDARHVCWAYMLGSDKTVWQLNDNGEPSGTAGKPILGQILSKDITDVMVIVVRYFGGIKLGTSGLIAAYREAAKLAIEDAEIVECHDMTRVDIEFVYEDLNGVMRVIKDNNIETLEKSFDNICRMSLNIKSEDFPKYEGILIDRGAKIIR